MLSEIVDREGHKWPVTWSVLIIYPTFDPNELKRDQLYVS